MTIQESAAPKNDEENNAAAAVIEAAPTETSADSAPHPAEARIRQQEILAKLGVFALQGSSFTALLDETARLTAEGMGAEFSKVLEYIPSQNRLLVRAGVGWDAGVIGSATVGADIESPAGYALHTGQPVISNHLEDEQRFRTPSLLLRHGIRRAMNVILQGEGKPYGVLEVDSQSQGEFTERDIAFLQGAANILGMAIERQRTESQLTAALAHQKVLSAEINHRAKNSLQLVSSMLQLQASVSSPEVAKHLTVASGRVSAVGKLYARLASNSGFDMVDVSAYLREVCADLDASQPHCVIRVEVGDVVMLAPESTIHLGLIVNELVTNACKYAYPGRTDGQVWVRVDRSQNSPLRLSIRDEGCGLPAQFDSNTAKGLGMQIVRSLIAQLGATLTTKRGGPGAEFVVSMPQA